MKETFPQLWAMNEAQFESNSLCLYPSDVAKIRSRCVMTVEMGFFCLTLNPDLLPLEQGVFERNNRECGDRDEIGMQICLF